MQLGRRIGYKDGARDETIKEDKRIWELNYEKIRGYVNGTIGRIRGY